MAREISRHNSRNLAIDEISRPLFISHQT